MVYSCCFISGGAIRDDAEHVLQCVCVCQCVYVRVSVLCGECACVFFHLRAHNQRVDYSGACNWGCSL